MPLAKTASTSSATPQKLTCGLSGLPPSGPRAVLLPPVAGRNAKQVGRWGHACSAAPRQLRHAHGTCRRPAAAASPHATVGKSSQWEGEGARHHGCTLLRPALPRCSRALHAQPSPLSNAAQAATASSPSRRLDDAVAANRGRLPAHRLLRVLLQDALDLLLGPPHHLLRGACRQAAVGVAGSTNACLERSCTCAACVDSHCARACLWAACLQVLGGRPELAKP